MKKYAVLTMIGFLISLMPTLAKTEKAIGQLIKPDKKLNLPYDYYMTLQKTDGKVLAFPVKSTKVDLSAMGKKQYYVIDFEPKTETLTIGEKQSKFTVINLLKARNLSLKDLQASTNTENIEKGTPKDRRGGQQNRPDLRMNDKLTNAVILTAGAILLGSIIAN